MKLPSVVRIATLADEPAILSLLESMHQEAGVFPLSKERVRAVVRDMLTAPTRPSAVPAIIGVIGTPLDLQATIGLIVSQLYYTDEFHCSDLWTFVRPDSRKSEHAKELIEFGKRTAASLGLKYMTGVTSNKRTEAKMRLYRRRLGDGLGGWFMFDPKAA